MLKPGCHLRRRMVCCRRGDRQRNRVDSSTVVSSVQFFTEPHDGPTVVILSSFTAIAIAAGPALGRSFWEYPSRSFDLAEKASIFVR